MAMWWLIRRVLVVLMTFITLLASVRLVGSRQKSLLPLIFTNPDGSPCQRPCLFGAEPGRMTSDEAVAVLKRHPLTRTMKVSERSDVAEYIVEAKGVRILVGRGGEHLYLLFVNNDNPDYELPAMPEDFPNSGALGEVILTFGSPQYVSMSSSTTRWDSGPGVETFYPDRYAYFTYRRIPFDYVSPGAPLATIFVRSDIGGLGIGAYMRPWTGFGRADRYPLEP
jgi:hypothetical protein